LLAVHEIRCLAVHVESSVHNDALAKRRLIHARTSHCALSNAGMHVYMRVNLVEEGMS
jgi:hypothetical protein